MECKIDFEILCQDDASNSSLNVLNEKINELSNSSFVSLTQNLAHRENRNSLAEKAKYNYLLFIDGDSNCISNNYIRNYISNLEGFDIVYGGRLHPEKCPSNNQKLRWKYGRFIEDKKAKIREKTPYQSLLFNNTLIKKEIFDKVKFDKNIKKYGHDDTQLSFQLSKLKPRVNHIDNPIEHGDIETNANYLNKTKESLENLIVLCREEKIETEFVKLIWLYTLLQKTKVDFIIRKLYSFFKNQIFKNLTGNNPSLFVFNVFKIGYLSNLNTN
jgi:hypothetical protein